MMNPPPPYQRAAAPISLDAIPNIVRGKALSYHPEQVFSIPEPGALRGLRHTVRDDQRSSTYKFVAAEKNERHVSIPEKVVKSDDSSIRARLTDSPPVDGIVFSRQIGNQNGNLIVYRTTEERYYIIQSNFTEHCGSFL